MMGGAVFPLAAAVLGATLLRATQPAAEPAEAGPEMEADIAREAEAA
jgi:hypothetical protein